MPIFHCFEFICLLWPDLCCAFGMLHHVYTFIAYYNLLQCSVWVYGGHCQRQIQPYDMGWVIMPNYLVFSMSYNLFDQLVQRCNLGLLKGGEVCYESIIFH
jgi:hypothetical protein